MARVMFRGDGVGSPHREDKFCTEHTCRPLVVIDPEDREHVERLTAAHCRWRASPQEYSPEEVLIMQAALRSLITPTKPEEPTGRYAVVEDDRAVEWVRAELVGTRQWHSLGGACSRWADWDTISAVKVLSEGVTP